MKKPHAILTTALAGLALLAPLSAQAQAAADRWEYSLMPYLWLPGMSGTLKYGPPSAGSATANVNADADKLLDALDFGLMLEGEARKGRWLIGADLIYLKLSSARSGIRDVDFNPGSGSVNVANTTINAGTDVTIKGTIFTLAGGYALLQEPHATVYGIGGLRYAGIEATTNWNLSGTIIGPGGVTFAASGSATKSENIVDAIIGVRGRFRLGDGNWFVPYYLDVGTGDSDKTYQAVLGIGHAFKWGEALLSYRYLYYDMGGDKLLQKFDFSGPAVGLNFRF
jgi:hypothetical protein